MRGSWRPAAALLAGLVSLAVCYLCYGRYRAIQAVAAQNSMPALRRERASRTASTSVATSSAAMADSGVEHCIEQVDGEIHQHEPGGHKEDDALQDDEVARVNRADQ